MKHLNEFNQFSENYRLPLFADINEGRDAEEVGRVKFSQDNDIVVKKGENFYVITQKSTIVPTKVNTIVVSDEVLREFLDIFREPNTKPEWSKIPSGK